MSDVMEKLTSLCKRRGFIFQSSEIYGGINGCYDYGPLGVELKRNVKEFWWHWMTRRREDIEGIDASILMHARVWEASGHVGGFSDPMVDCRDSKGRYRADQLTILSRVDDDGSARMYAFSEGDDDGRARAEKLLAKYEKADLPLDPERYGTRSFTDLSADDLARVVGPETKEAGTLTEPRNFNLMFKTFVGPLEDTSATAFLRPETAQGIYVNFHNVATSARRKIPFGIAQIGKAFRNEINPRNYTFRTREFEQMEMQFFVRPGTDEKWFETWKQDRLDYYKDLGVRGDRLRYHEHGDGELAHYARAAFDIEYEFPFGWKELEGIHNRTDFDLGRHQEYANKPLTYFDEEIRERYLPYVIEASAGCDRTILAVLCDAYDEEEGKGGKSRVVLRLDPRLAPVKAGIFPLVKRDGLPEKARAIYEDVKKRHRVIYEESGSIGKRYWRQDEAGTPFCFTVDSETLEDGTVTVRDRDAMTQEKVAADRVADFLSDKITLD